MGMYTQIHVYGTCEITNPAVTVLEHLFNNGSEPENLPEHEFFLCPRWNHVGSVTSYYHSPLLLNKSSVENGQYYFHSVSDLKNYNDEIAKFFDWLKANDVRFAGSWRYEEPDVDEGFVNHEKL